jgi:heat shock protein HslJ
MKIKLNSFIVIFILIGMLMTLSGCINTNENIKGKYSLISYGASNNLTLSIPNITTFINFNLDGTFNGNVGCNSFSGKYKIVRDILKISYMISTEMYCENTSIQESVVFNILNNKNLHYYKINTNLTIVSNIGVINLGERYD